MYQSVVHNKGQTAARIRCTPEGVLGICNKSLGFFLILLTKCKKFVAIFFFFLIIVNLLVHKNQINSNNDTNDNTLSLY